MMIQNQIVITCFISSVSYSAAYYSYWKPINCDENGNEFYDFFYSLFCNLLITLNIFISSIQFLAFIVFFAIKYLIMRNINQI